MAKNDQKTDIFFHKDFRNFSQRPKESATSNGSQGFTRELKELKIQNNAYCQWQFLKTTSGTKAFLQLLQLVGSQTNSSIEYHVTHEVCLFSTFSQPADKSIMSRVI